MSVLTDNTAKLYEIRENIQNSLGSTVKYTQQTLTDEQKAQARANIGIEEIQKFTSLPSSGTTLTANAEYRISSTVGTYQFKFPSSGDVYVKFKTASTFTISFASGTTYLGSAPNFEASTTYEMFARDGVVAVAAVVSA